MKIHSPAFAQSVISLVPLLSVCYAAFYLHPEFEQGCQVIECVQLIETDAYRRETGGGWEGDGELCVREGEKSSVNRSRV